MLRPELIPVGTAHNGDEVLAQVQEAIRAEPLRVDMSIVFESARSQWSSGLHRPWPACGAQGCIRGWVKAMFGGIDFSRNEDGFHPTNLSWERVLPLSLSGEFTLFDQDWWELCFAGTSSKIYPWPDQKLPPVHYAAAVIANIEKFRNKWKTELLSHTF